MKPQTSVCSSVYDTVLNKHSELIEKHSHK